MSVGKELRQSTAGRLVFAPWFLRPHMEDSKTENLILSESLYVHMLVACYRLSWDCWLKYSHVTFYVTWASSHHGGWVPRQASQERDGVGRWKLYFLLCPGFTMLLLLHCESSNKSLTGFKGRGNTFHLLIRE